jgi:hypothetical protein
MLTLAALYDVESAATRLDLWIFRCDTHPWIWLVVDVPNCRWRRADLDPAAQDRDAAVGKDRVERRCVLAVRANGSAASLNGRVRQRDYAGVWSCLNTCVVCHRIQQVEADDPPHLHCLTLVQSVINCWRFAASGATQRLRKLTLPVRCPKHRSDS